MTTRHSIACSISFGLLTASGALAGLVQYNTSPGSYPNVTVALNAEFGTTALPPISETALSYYTVNGVGPSTVNFRFKDDHGGFLFNFGYYNVTPSLLAIDTSTDAGKMAYATQALAAGSATLLFDDATQNPGATASISANGGDTLGFFLIPNNTLTQFQTNPAAFALTGLGSPLRWPFFGLADANPGGEDQLMSFSGTSTVTGTTTSLFAWEDLTRVPGAGSDSNFSDLIFAVDGITAAPPSVPEPATFSFGLALLGASALSRCRSKRQ